MYAYTCIQIFRNTHFSYLPYFGCSILYYNIENTEYQTSCWSGGLSDSARVHFAHLMKVYRGFISDHNY